MRVGGAEGGRGGSLVPFHRSSDKKTVDPPRTYSEDGTSDFNKDLNRFRTSSQPIRQPAFTTFIFNDKQTELCHLK